MADGESQSSDENPYEVAQVMDAEVFQDRPRPPGVIATFFSVVLGLVVAAAAFGVTFLFTGLGVISTRSLDFEVGMAIVIGISGLTSVAAFLFTMWGVLKQGKLFRNTSSGP